MPVDFPGTADALQLVFMDADGPHSLTAIPIPSGQSIALLTAGQPSTWQNIAKGGYPILPPGALVLGTPSGYSTFGAMTPNQAYQYSLTNVTDYGETLESAVLTVTAVQMGTNTSVRLNLPPDAQSTTDVKVRARRLYRSTAGGSTRGFVAQINDMALTHYIDGLSDTGLGDAPPSSDTSGAVGAVGVVSTDGAYASWTEKQYGSALAGGQFSVDYGFDANGGTVHFAAVDVGKHITITFTASIALTSAFFNSQIQAIKDIRTVLGDTPQGAAADLTTRLSTAGLDNLPLISDDVAALYGTVPDANTAHAPAIVSSTAMGLTPGSRCAIFEHYLIVPLNTRWTVYDISDPVHPVSVSSTTIAGQCRAVAVMGEYVFIANGSTIYCYALYAPQTPVAQTNISAVGGTILDLAVQGQYLIALISGINTIKVWDMGSTPGSGGTLYATGSVTMTTPLKMVQFEDDYVNVIDGGANALIGFNIPSGTAIGNVVDATNIPNPTDLATAQGMVAIANANAGSSVSLFTDHPGAQTFVAKVGFSASTGVIGAAGEYIYAAANGLLYLIDVSTAATPTLLTPGGVAIGAGAYGTVVVYGDFLILPNTTDGKLYVVNLTFLRSAAAHIGSLKAGHVRALDGVQSSGPLVAPRLMIGRGGALIDGDVSFTGNMVGLRRGTLTIPSGTVNGTNLTVNDARARAGDAILLTLVAPINLVSEVAYVDGSIVAGTSFQVDVFTGGTTTAAVKATYLIVT